MGTPRAIGSENLPRTVVDIDSSPFSSLTGQLEGLLKRLEEINSNIERNTKDQTQAKLEDPMATLERGLPILEHIRQLQASMATLEQRLPSAEHISNMEMQQAHIT